MKKIAVFQVDLNIGGIQKSCVSMLNNMDASKYEIDLYLVEKNGVFLPDLNPAINVKYIKKMPYFTRLIPFFLLKLFYNLKIEKQYDLVIDFNSYSNETAISAIKTRSNKKIMWIHNDVKIKRKEEIRYRILHFFFKGKYKYFDKFVAVSDGVLASFKDVNKVKDKEFDVIPNFIDVEDIKKKIKEKNNVKVDKKLINVCSTGRLVHQKGFDILIETINSIKDKIPNYHFYFIGDGPMFQNLRTKISEYNLGNIVTLTGFLENPYSLMNEMDAFVLLSRYEGQGMVFLEAYSLGLDIIMPKHLEKYVDGFLVGTHDVVKSILDLKKHKHKFNELTEYNENIKKKINNL